MSNMLKLLVDFVGYNSNQPENNPQYGDSTKIKNTISQSFSELSRQQFKVATSATDQSISLVDSSCDYVLIFCDYNLNIKLNGSVTAIPLIPKADGVKTFVFMVKGTITSLLVTNPSGTFEVNLDIISVNL